MGQLVAASNRQLTAAENAVSVPLLSICIPTYQRRERAEALVREMLTAEEGVEVCVHIDGSEDGTYEVLSVLAEGEPRLRVSRAANQGRAYALAAAFHIARGEFVMFYDDDDHIDAAGLEHVLRRLRGELPSGVCGYVFQMKDDGGDVIGGLLPARSNFLRMRADDGVTGDKKEVVRRDFLEASFYTPGQNRRVPTSTLWARLALRYDVIGDNTVVGSKHYLVGGYSNRIQRLKRDYPGPMALVNAYRALGFLLGRYRSPRYFLRSLGGLLLHSINALFRRRPPLERASFAQDSAL